MSDLIQTAAFLKRHLKAIQRMGCSRHARENLLMWLAHHDAKKHICRIENNGKIMAVGIARSIEMIGDDRFPFNESSTGKILYVDQVAAKENLAFKMLLVWVKARWPYCTHILFNRSKNGSYNNLYDMNTFMRKAGI